MWNGFDELRLTYGRFAALVPNTMIHDSSKVLLSCCDTRRMVGLSMLDCREVILAGIRTLVNWLYTFL